jgi:hypothetical protein
VKSEVKSPADNLAKWERSREEFFEISFTSWL